MFLKLFSSWLDEIKALNKQVKLEPRSTLLRFCDKLYPPDPALLQEEYARSDNTETPTAALLQNGMEMEKEEETQDSEKPVSTSATVVSKVQNGGVARHAKDELGNWC
ncbi:uncharacterized protein LOC122952022 isoform X2 [Acropora millepora]|uniref:uncharacterized protein LOC122952022 isoform X2 n=1 Tax=Acropora millepora TaxID=45264 RepID=UPI001CF3397F|nr:uncharacterized protein LOC122952022 isoform X2 [Acropora millepora]